jgi:phosphatidate phosphatase APP1
MSDGSPIARFLSDLANVGSAARDVVARRLPRSPLGLALYDGFGSADRVLVHGRALRDERLPAPSPSDARWRNLVAMLRRADSDPIPHARVRVRAGTSRQEFRADDEGFFHGWMPASALERVDADWALISAELVESIEGGPPVTAAAAALVPTAPPQLLIISDIDDTVLQSRVTNLIGALRTMLLENAHTRLPFPGVAAFYRALRAGPAGTGHNPTFYVSSSPWNLYDVITEFLRIQGIPKGPIMLRDVDLGFDTLSSRHHHAHKREMIRRVLTTYPAIPAVLIGDSGQQDPEIYRDVVREFSGRIRAVYIRDVSGLPDRSRVIEQLAAEVLEAGSTLLLAPDTLAAASHAVELGLISKDALPEIGAEKKADEPG